MDKQESAIFDLADKVNHLALSEVGEAKEKLIEAAGLLLTAATMHHLASAHPDPKPTSYRGNIGGATK